MKQAYLLLGEIVRPQGIRGEVKVRHYTDDPERFFDLETVYCKKGESYGIPYRALAVKGLSNLLTAGRCISCDRYMQSSVRVMPGCYITGQAAGMAASMCAENCINIHDVDVHTLQGKLKAMGAFLPNYKD